MKDRRYLDRLLALDAHDELSFNVLAEEVFTHQCDNCSVYRAYVDAMGVQAYEDWESAPPLPIAAFKSGPVASFPFEKAEAVFESSGTGRGKQSKHYFLDLDLYGKLSQRHFSDVFGNGPFTLLAHLPGYADQGDRSSLVYMVQQILDVFGGAGSRFFLGNPDRIFDSLAKSRHLAHPVVLFGAAFGLLDLLDGSSWVLPVGSRLVETGGMKTHRREIGREQLHLRLAQGFGIPRSSVLSEYGMCEMTSQCYSSGGAVLFPPPWLRIRIVDPENPAVEVADGEMGLVSFFDLANLHSVSAVLTEDIGRKVGTGFEVHGRMSGADLRGCNYLVTFNG